MLSKKRVFHLNHVTSEGSTKPSIFRGLFYAMMSGVVFSLLSVIVKHMKNVHPGQLALYRYIGVFVMSMPETVRSSQNLLGPPKLRIFMVLRGISAGLFGFWSFIAFRYLGIGEASVIMFSSPVVVTIFARIFLKEPCNIFQTVTLILTVTGIIFTSKLPSRLSEIPVVYSSEKIYGLLASILALFSVSSLQIFTRKVRHVHTSISNFHLGWVSISELAILMAIFGNFELPQCGFQNVYILLLASLSYAGLTLVTMALQCEYAGPVATVRAATDIGLAFLWQIFFFHDVPDTYGIVGAVLVSFSIILTSFDKWIASSQGSLFSCERLK